MNCANFINVMNPAGRLCNVRCDLKAGLTHSCTDLAILISEPGPTAVPDPDRVWTAPDRHSLKQ